MAMKGKVGSVADTKPAQKTAGPSKGKSRELRRDVEGMKDKFENNYVQMPQQYGGLFGGPAGAERSGNDLAGAEKFPARLGYRDKYDTMYELKSTLPNDSNLGYKIFTDEDAEYLVRKQEMQNAASFKQFLASMYDMRDPAQAALAHKLYPELMEERLSIVDQRADLEKALAKMRIRGYPTREEALVLWGAASGAISLPTGTLWDPNSWEDMSQSGQTNKLARGMFSPMKQYDASVNRARFPGDILGGAAIGGNAQPNRLGSALGIPSAPFGGAVQSAQTTQNILGGAATYPPPSRAAIG